MPDLGLSAPAPTPWPAPSAGPAPGRREAGRGPPGRPMAGEASEPRPLCLGSNCLQGLMLLPTRGPRVSAGPLPSPLKAPPPLRPCWLPGSAVQWTGEAERSPASPGHPPGGRRRHCPRHLRPAPRPRPVQLHRRSLESKDVQQVSRALTRTPGTDSPVCQGPGPGTGTQEQAGGAQSARRQGTPTTSR